MKGKLTVKVARQIVEETSHVEDRKFSQRGGFESSLELRQSIFDVLCIREIHVCDCEETQKRWLGKKR